MAFTSIATLAAAALASVAPGQGVDPLAARVDEGAAQLFAEVWRSTGGKPTASQLETAYLSKGGRGVEVFTPNRIVNAENLAATIASEPDVYRDAVERCLPWVSETNRQLRSADLGLKGLFPNHQLPQIAVVVGANNSGGTAAQGIQVIGLEVICRLSPTREAFETRMREFFTHETVHTFQGELSPKARREGLFAQAIVEGVPDYVASLVTGQVPDQDRDQWARAREPWVWQQFRADAAIVRAGTDEKGDWSPEAMTAFKRWFANAGQPPAGWPSELGYWVGMQIAAHYVAAAHEPHTALEQLLDPVDPAAIVAASKYAPR